MIFGLKPIEITLNKGRCALYVLGFIHGRRNAIHHRSLGFSIHKDRKPDRSVWILSLSFWWLYKHIEISSIYDRHYLKCNYCGGLVWKNNMFCPTCGCEMDAKEVTFIYRRPLRHWSEIEELKGTGHQVKIISQIIVSKSFHKGITSPRELLQRFPDLKLVPAYGYNRINLDGSFCQMNIDKTLTDANIPFEKDEDCDYVIE